MTKIRADKARELKVTGQLCYSRIAAMRLRLEKIF